MVHSLVPGWSRLGLCRRKEQIPHEEAAPHFLISTLRNARTPCTENPDCLQARLQVGREHLMRARLSGQITLSSLVSLSHLPKPFFSVCSLSASESETGKDAGEKLTLPFVYFWRNILRLRNIWPTYTINGCFEKFKQANKDPLHSHQWKLCQAEVAPVLSHLKQPKRFYSCIYFCTLGAEWEWEDLVITHCWGGVCSSSWPLSMLAHDFLYHVSVSRVGSLVTSTTHISFPEHRSVATCVASLRGWQTLRCKPGVNFDFMISIEKIQKWMSF